MYNHYTCEYVLAAVVSVSKTVLSVFTVSGLLEAAWKIYI